MIALFMSVSPVAATPARLAVSAGKSAGFPIFFPYPCDSPCSAKPYRTVTCSGGVLTNAQHPSHCHSEAAGALTSRVRHWSHLPGWICRARETQTVSSDIDLAFDLAPGASKRFSFIDQSRIQRQLAAALGIHVDLIERDYLRRRVSARAE